MGHMCIPSEYLPAAAVAAAWACRLGLAGYGNKPKQRQPLRPAAAVPYVMISIWVDGVESSRRAKSSNDCFWLMHARCSSHDLSSCTEVWVTPVHSYDASGQAEVGVRALKPVTVVEACGNPFWPKIVSVLQPSDSGSAVICGDLYCTPGACSGAQTELRATQVCASGILCLFVPRQHQFASRKFWLSARAGVR